MEKKMKIGLRNRGLYTASSEYDILDFISANNAIYISLKAGNVGHDLSDTEWWQCSIQGTGVTQEELQSILNNYIKKGDVVVESIEVNTIQSLE